MFSETDTVLNGEAKEKIVALLKKKHYRIREKRAILAEKGVFRWGPYVNHIGLIIFLIGAMLRFVPGMYVDETLWVREGETATIPGTDGKYYLKNNQFSVETYNSKTEKGIRRCD